MSLAPRLDLRQTQSLVMTPQLQQAIKLLALSNLEVETFIGEAVEANPLLELGESAAPELAAIEPPADERRTRLEDSPVDALIGEGRGAEDRPLDVEPADFDGDTAGPASAPLSDWGSGGGGSDAVDGEWPLPEDRGSGPLTLADHLIAQIGITARDLQSAAIARHVTGLLDESGYLSATLDETAEALGVSLEEAASAIALIQSLDPVGVGARSLSECIALQAREADRYDPAMAKLIDKWDPLESTCRHASLSIL